jgi:hypothetical protein
VGQHVVHLIRNDTGVYIAPNVMWNLSTSTTPADIPAVYEALWGKIVVKAVPVVQQKADSNVGVSGRPPCMPTSNWTVS